MLSPVFPGGVSEAGTGTGGAPLESLPPCGQPRSPETALKPGGPEPQPGLPSAESAGAQNLPCGRVNDFVSLAFM